MPLKGSRTIRFFVSSTFSDFTAERDVLQRGVVGPDGERLAASPFERAREMCREAGLSFEPVDLRWGISAAAAESSATMARCLAEVRRACDSHAPNFMALIGDRYGWRPVPTTLAAERMDEVLAALGSERTLIEQWYRLETNAVPPTYVLDSSRGHPPPHVEQQLRQALMDGWASVGDEPPGSMFGSATEQEILLALADRLPGDDHGAALVYERAMDGLPDDPTVARYVDVRRDGSPDADSHRAVRQLRRTLAADRRVSHRRYDVASRDGALITTEYLMRFARDVTHDLETRIAATVDELAASVATREVGQHHAFAAELVGSFTGRAAERAAIERYLDTPTGGPLVISGRGGTGKSTMAAWAADAALDRGFRVLLRFVGATPAATTGERLEADLASEVGDSGPGDGLMAALAGIGDEPTLVIVDGLDLLALDDELRSYSWMPLQWPTRLRVVVSSRERRDVERLRRLVPTSVELELGALASEEAAALFDRRLADVGRQVTSRQRDGVVAAFVRESRPLFVRLVADLAARWSDAEDGRIGATGLDELIETAFSELAEEHRHGTVLTSSSLGLLAASRFGLSDGEMHEALSSDERVVESFRRRHPDSPPIEGLPFILWAALRADLEPYLATRVAAGAELVDFFHLDVRRAAARRFLDGDAATEHHSRLSELFHRHGTSGDGAWLPSAGRAASEASHHLLAGGDLQGFDDLAEDAAFLTAIAGPDHHVAGRSERLPAPCAELIARFDRRSRSEERSESAARAVAALRTGREVLAIRPQAAAQLLANAGLDVRGPVGADGTALLRRDHAAAPGVDHGTLITALAVSSDGTGIVAGDSEGRVSWRAVDRPEPRWCVAAHERWVTDVAISPSGEWAASGSDDGGVQLWSTAHGESRTLDFPWHWSPMPPAQGVGFVDDSTLVVVRMGRAFEVDVETGRVRRLPGCPGLEMGVEIGAPEQFRLCPSRRVAVQCGGMLKPHILVGDLAAGAPIVEQELSAHVATIACDGGGGVLLSSVDGLRVFDLSRPADDPMHRPGPVMTSLSPARAGHFVGLSTDRDGKTLVLGIDTELTVEALATVPVEEGRHQPHLVRVPATGDVAILGWSSGRVTVVDLRTGTELRRSSPIGRLARGAISATGEAGLGHLASGLADEAFETVLAHPDVAPSPLRLDQRDMLLGVAAAGSQLVSVDRTGQLTGVDADGHASGSLQATRSPNAAAEWRGVDGVAIGTTDGRVVLVGRSPATVDLGASRLYGRVPVVAVDAAGAEADVAVGLRNGLTGWRVGGVTNWRPVDPHDNLAPTVVALLEAGRVADGNELGRVRVWSPDREEPVLEWDAHVGPVVSIDELPAGGLLTTGASGSVVLVDAERVVRGVGMVDGGIAAARLVDESALIVLRRDGWLVRFEIGA